MSSNGARDFDGFIERLDLGGDGAAASLAVAVKDTIDIAGLPTRCGSRAFEDAAPAPRHAQVVRNLLDAGCRIVGKTALHELAFGVTGVNAWSGTPRNPRFPLFIPGGSSSGSAAVVAAGLADFALGTDTGGSIRMPAACCGVFGFKPSYGRVSRAGVHPAHSSLDCVGPFARSLAMIATAMAAIDPGFSAPAASDRPRRLGLVRIEAEAAIADAVEAAARASGAETVAIDLDAFDEAFAAGLAIINFENWAAFNPLLATGKLGPDVAARLARAADTTPEQVAAAERVRRRLSASIDAALETCDALVLPTLPSFPQTLADALAGGMDLRATALIRPFNLSGHPALALPLPPDAGRPVSLQLVGRKGGDEALLAVAAQLFPDRNLPI